MSMITTFIQVHGRSGILEVELSDTTTLGELFDTLAAFDVNVDAETFIFVDEAEEHEQGQSHDRIGGLKRGSRIHVSQCKRITTCVNFLDKTADKEFPPGTRIRAVKAWAVREFHMDPKDAAEHVLQICKSTERPSSDTPLLQLVHGHGCTLCFDLVPEKRVEG